MKTTTEIPSVKELQKVIYNPSVKKKLSNHIETLRIDTDAEGLTRIDFLYRAPHYYINGGWVQISRHTFIRPCGSDKKLTMVKAVNIPIAPTKHFFKKSNEILCYTLYFPALPKGTSSIDIIEAEGPGGNWFNFYGVSVEKIRSEKIIVNHS
jgi:hypothetical protein